MAKPEITLDMSITHLVFDKGRFGAIETRRHSFNHITLFPPHTDKLLVSIVNTDSPAMRDPNWIEALGKHIQESSYLHSYIIWDSDYSYVKQLYRPYDILRDPSYKLVFAHNLGAAIDYGVGLVEKACKYGIYA